MLASEAKITVEAGHGGPGKVSFFAMKRGPSGGNGGRGGDVYAELNHNVRDLRKYIEKTTYTANPGTGGSINRMNGHDAENLILLLPPGTTIKDLETSEEIDLTPANSPLLICRGGIGGRGNDAFKSPTNRTPKKAEPGRPGQKRELLLILKLIADYGLIGLPNVGKSTLLNLLTAANVKTANYPFTTLEPNLGVFNKKVLADIPGLIEGASSGKGLGIKFLKHIEKVQLLLHCVSAESADVMKDYETVRAELGKYNQNLLNKPEIILLTKTDNAEESEIKNKVQQLEKYGNKVISINIYDETALKKLKDLIV